MGVEIDIWKCPHCGKEIPHNADDMGVVIHCQTIAIEDDLTGHLQADSCHHIGVVNIPDEYILAKFKEQKS